VYSKAFRFVDSLKEFLPQSYVKVKNVEKKVFAEHRKHIGISELDAKVLYTKTARSLSTYGVTFFLVKVSAAISRLMINRKVSFRSNPIPETQQRVY